MLVFIVLCTFYKKRSKDTVAAFSRAVVFGSIYDIYLLGLSVSNAVLNLNTCMTKDLSLCLPFDTEVAITKSLGTFYNVNETRKLGHIFFFSPQTYLRFILRERTESALRLAG